jgi:hypothetical protein
MSQKSKLFITTAVRTSNVEERFFPILFHVRRKTDSPVKGYATGAGRKQLCAKCGRYFVLERR